jgi:hypothetical protein
MTTGDILPDTGHRWGEPSLWEAYWNHIMPKKTVITSASTIGENMVMVICEHCGGSHVSRTCPRIKVIEYHENGQVKRIEFFETVTEEPPVITIGPVKWPDGETEASHAKLTRKLLEIGL